MKKTFLSFVIGCRVNEAEKIFLDKLIEMKGYIYDTYSPQVILINSCAVTIKAERETRQLIYQLKKKYPSAHIILTGCAATLWKKNNLTSISGVTYVENSLKFAIADLINNQSKPTHTIDFSHDKFISSGRLFIKIQDGCNRFCRYCIVPYLRGTPQSTPITTIIETINETKHILHRQGKHLSEVVLTAINTECYGKDTNTSLIELLQAILSETNVPRIGFGSIHPWSLTDEFLAYYKTHLAKEKRFIHFFHVPIQSGSDMILKLMKRDYTINSILSKLKQIQSFRPDALIATDVIVGFLGESETAFEETYHALSSSPISRFHVFRFSPRPHTAAYFLKKRIFEPTPQEKTKRAKRLIQLGKTAYKRFIASLVGLKTQALVLGQDKQTNTRILLQNNVEGIIANSHCLPGTIQHVTITSIQKEKVVCVLES